MIVLDTSYLIDFFKNEDLKSLIPDNDKPAVTVISYYEIMGRNSMIEVSKRRKIFPAFFLGYRNPGIQPPCCGYRKRYRGTDGSNRKPGECV